MIVFPLLVIDPPNGLWYGRNLIGFILYFLLSEAQLSIFTSLELRIYAPSLPQVVEDAL